MELIKNGFKIGRIHRTSLLWIRAHNYGNDVYGVTEGPYDSVLPLVNNPGKTFHDVIIQLNMDMTFQVQHWWNAWDNTWENTPIVQRPTIFRLQVAGEDTYDEFLLWIQMRNVPNYIFFLTPGTLPVSGQHPFSFDPTAQWFAGNITGSETSFQILQKLHEVMATSGVFTDLVEAGGIRLTCTFKKPTDLFNQTVQYVTQGAPFTAITGFKIQQGVPYY
jgi:hypothetical protein